MPVTETLMKKMNLYKQVQAEQHSKDHRVSHRWKIALCCKRIPAYLQIKIILLFKKYKHDHLTTFLMVFETDLSPAFVVKLGVQTWTRKK